jgi:hypothetical protein
MAENAGGKKGYHLKSRPKEYPLTKQQQIFKEVIKECGIKKGITKDELQKQMKECVGPKLKERYKKESDSH